MTNTKNGTVLQRTASGRSLFVIVAVTIGMIASCSGYLMANPPIHYIAVDLEGSTIHWTIRNCSSRTIVWMELSFNLFAGDGAQIPEFGENYFTIRETRNVIPGEQIVLATSLEPYVELLPADAMVGLFFAREVRFLDGTVWWNSGSYRYNKGEM